MWLCFFEVDREGVMGDIVPHSRSTCGLGRYCMIRYRTSDVR